MLKMYPAFFWLLCEPFQNLPRMTALSLPCLTPPLTVTVGSQWPGATKLAATTRKIISLKTPLETLWSICSKQLPKIIFWPFRGKPFSWLFHSWSHMRSIPCVGWTVKSKNTFLLANLWNTSLMWIRHCSVRTCKFRLSRKKEIHFFYKIVYYCSLFDFWVICRCLKMHFPPNNAELFVSLRGC